MSEPAEQTEPAVQTAAPAGRSGGRSSYLRSGITALVVLAVIAFLINLLLLQRHTGSTSDGAQLAQRIAQGLQSKTKAVAPPQVWCPAAIPKTETHFTCKLQAHKNAGWVAVRVTGGHGTFTWTQTTETVTPPP